MYEWLVTIHLDSPHLLRARDFLARNDAYTFFDSHGSLLRTGPTHTNVCDLRIVLSGAPG